MVIKTGTSFAEKFLSVRVKSADARLVRAKLFKLHDFGIALHIRQDNFFDVELKQELIT